MADYAVTDRNMNGAFRARLVARAVAAGIDEQQIAVKVGSPPALMRETLAWLRDRQGGPLGLLRSHGMTESEIAALRGALVAPGAARAA